MNWLVYLNIRWILSNMPEMTSIVQSRMQSSKKNQNKDSLPMIIHKETYLNYKRFEDSKGVCQRIKKLARDFLLRRRLKRQWMRKKLGRIEEAMDKARNVEDESMWNIYGSTTIDENALDRCVPPTSFWLILDTSLNGLDYNHLQTNEA